MWPRPGSNRESTQTRLLHVAWHVPLLSFIAHTTLLHVNNTSQLLAFCTAATQRHQLAKTSSARVCGIHNQNKFTRRSLFGCRCYAATAKAPQQTTKKQIQHKYAFGCHCLARAVQQPQTKHNKCNISNSMPLPCTLAWSVQQPRNKQMQHKQAYAHVL